MSNTPVPNSPMSRNRTPPSSLIRLLIIVAIVGVLVLVLLSLSHPPTNSPSQVTTPLSEAITLTPTPSSAAANGADETTGIILAGIFLVLIVLGGTIGATRRKS